MLAEEFIAQKKPAWERLSTLLGKSQLGGLTTLSAEELNDLGRLYRTATSDLAVARRDFTSHRMTEYLNGLVARGHAAIYQSHASRRSSVWQFFSSGFPRAFRETWPYTLAAFLMFFLPALVSFVISYRDPAAGAALMPGLAGAIDDIRSGTEWWQRINDDGRAASSTLIMTNNIQVAITAFAGGMLMGTLTLYALVQNGLMLGVLAGASQSLGFSGNLWGFIAAHGVIELSVIFIAGGAGLQLGWSLFRPGLFSRRAALSIAAQRAMLLLLGCIPLLVIAGTIEGFISPSSLPVAIKLLVALLSGIALYGYLLLSGRPVKQRRT
ncbi:MAG: stage II sporulation protein M [Roseiflexaceae bacterium]|nr:stage II sporulation protein M [Roseiflexaceae bacterium]